jgi:hypothetical protein
LQAGGLREQPDLARARNADIRFVSRRDFRLAVSGDADFDALGRSAWVQAVPWKVGRRHL